MGFCITDHFVVMVHECSLCLVLCKYKVFFSAYFTYFSAYLFYHFKVSERIFMKGVGKQACRCMNGYCSAVLLMPQMPEAVYLSYSTVWVYLIICR